MARGDQVIVGSWQIKEILGVDTQFIQGFTAALRDAGVTVNAKQARTKDGHFRIMNVFDIEKGLKAFEKNIKTHPYRGRYIRHWQERVRQLNEIKKGMEWTKKQRS
jgi:hypothetical protein